MKTRDIAGWMVATGLLLLAGCASKYVAPPETSTRQMFLDACARCHVPEDKVRQVWFRLDEEDRDIAVIAKRIREGGVMMPAFPKLTDDQVQALAEYVFKHSKVEK